MKKRKTTCVLLASLLLCGVFLSVPSRAAGTVSVTENRVTDRNTGSYEKLTVRAGAQKKNVGGYLINSTTYVAFRSLSEALSDCQISYDPKTRTATATDRGLSLTVTDGAHYLTVNGRCFYLDMPATILSDGRFYLPVRPLAAAFCAEVGWDPASRSVTVEKSRGYATPAEEFYNAGDLFWLSRIISAESRGEPFLGQIAVGNVIQNRIRSSAYPDTVYGVIFDKKYGTQFTPAANGTVYMQPTESAIRAAKICLEGTTVSEKILYFYEPTIAVSSWIGQNRPYAFRIGAHLFYN